MSFWKAGTQRGLKASLLFHYGKVVFLTSFCPRGMFGDVLALFEGAGSLRDITREDWKEFAEGLAYVLSCFYKMNYDSLNMTLLTNLRRDEGFWVQARILPRAGIPPLGTSDVNYKALATLVMVRPSWVVPQQQIRRRAFT